MSDCEHPSIQRSLERPQPVGMAYLPREARTCCLDCGRTVVVDIETRQMRAESEPLSEDVLRHLRKLVP